MQKYGISINWVSNTKKSICKLSLAENHGSFDELTNFDKMVIIFDRRLLELNGFHFGGYVFSNQREIQL